MLPVRYAALLFLVLAPPAALAFNDGTGTYATGTMLPLVRGIWSVAAADLDGNGDVDLAATDTDYNYTGNIAAVFLTLGIAESQAVRAEVFDGLGRWVATLQTAHSRRARTRSRSTGRRSRPGSTSSAWRGRRSPSPAVPRSRDSPIGAQDV
jgi:hypothetical protein